MENQNNSVVKTSEWMGIMLVMAIPFVNFILLLVWAFSSGEPASKSNWAKATLLWMLIISVIYIVIAIVFGATLLAMYQNGF